MSDEHDQPPMPSSSISYAISRTLDSIKATMSIIAENETGLNARYSAAA